MIKVTYDVHSDTNENNIFESFDGRGAKQAAIAYAKRNKDEQTWVDRVTYNESTNEYEYECAWSYAWDEEYEQ